MLSELILESVKNLKSLINKGYILNNNVWVKDNKICLAGAWLVKHCELEEDGYSQALWEPPFELSEKDKACAMAINAVRVGEITTAIQIYYKKDFYVPNFECIRSNEVNIFIKEILERVEFIKECECSL